MGFFNKFRKQPTVAQEFISIPVTTLWRDVAEFVAKLETEESAEWCKCLWRIHPDDVGIKPGHCRLCNNTRKAGKHGIDHQFRGIRKTKVDPHPTCTVHTKEGLIIGFLEWAAKPGPIKVSNTGSAVADGPGSVANTGIMYG